MCQSQQKYASQSQYQIIASKSDHFFLKNVATLCVWAVMWLRPLNELERNKINQKSPKQKQQLMSVFHELTKKETLCLASCRAVRHFISPVVFGQQCRNVANDVIMISSLGFLSYGDHRPAHSCRLLRLLLLDSDPDSETTSEKAYSFFPSSSSLLLSPCFLQQCYIITL